MAETLLRPFKGEDAVPKRVAARHQTVFETPEVEYDPRASPERSRDRKVDRGSVCYVFV